MPMVPRIPGAPTLTRGQMLSNAAARRGPAPPPRKPAGPLLPDRPPADPYDSIIARLPQPMTSAQIGKQAQGEISPLLAALAGTVNKQAQSAQHAISGYSQDAASKLAGIDYGAPYRQAESGQAAIDAALQQSLTGAGSSDAAALSQRLGVINDPSVAAAAGGLASSGAAAGTTALASGSANLGSLLANAAAADSYGQKLPGLTRLAAEQQIAQAGAQAQQTIATDAAQLEQQLPGIISSLQSRSDSNATNIATARQNQLKRTDELAAGGAKAALTEQGNQIKVQTVNANNATRLQIAQMNANGRLTGQQLAQARSDRSYRLQFTKTNGYDPVNGRIAPGFAKGKGGQVVKVGTAKTPAAAKGLTASQVQKYRGLAATIADQGYTGFTDAKGVAHPKLTRDQAIEEAQKEGIPDKIALQYINQRYGAPVSPKAAKKAVATPGWLG